jgi:hypothetical protein
LSERLSESRWLVILAWWAPVVVGAVVALLIFRLINFVVPKFRASVAYESRGEIMVMTPERQMLVDALQLFLSVVLAHFLGGLIAGRITSSSPGLNGALTAVLAALVKIVKLLALYATIVGSPTGMDSENGGPFFLHVMAFVLFFPLTIILGYLGGSLGGRLRPATG